jgi:hypothetical protein
MFLLKVLAFLLVYCTPSLAATRRRVVKVDSSRKLSQRVGGSLVADEDSNV